MRLSFGVWYDFRNPAPWRRPWRSLYEETLEQIAWVDSLGFDSVWVSEHHFTDDGYLPSVLPMLAASAMRTTHVRLGTAVLLAPLHHPLRLAEDAAVVDVLSGGRLELGLAPGYRSEEFARLGIPRRERGSRTDETIEVVKAAWSGHPFSYVGKHFAFENVVVTPPPLQQPHPPIWVGGSGMAAARRAARHQCHFLPDGDASREVYEAYRSATAAMSSASSSRVATARVVYVCDDPERGWAEIKDHYGYAADRFRAWYGNEAPREAGAGADDPQARLQRGYFVGTPDMVTEGIAHLVEQLRLDRLIFCARPPGLPIESSSRSLELFADRVLPRFAA